MVLLDIDMTGIDGYETCERIKSDPAIKDIPVIFLTGKSAPEDIIKGFQVGGADYITKPFRAEEVLVRLKTQIKITHSSKIIKQQNKKLLELNATKDKFFSIVAHDLKNPFNALLGFSDILINDYDELSEDEKRDFISEMGKVSQFSYNLLENLLEWSRSQTGSLEFHPTQVDLFELVEEEKMLLGAGAKKKKITIVSEMSDGDYVFADRNMVKTILRNLISNAIKFTDKDGTIRVFRESDNEHMTIGVQDTGVGMDEVTQNKIFKIGESHSTIGTQEERGTGLGLILCREFVEKHDGKIWVESELQKGSVFYFTLPVYLESED